MRYSLAIFDLDGTILDTLQDLADSLNVILIRHGMPERTVGQVRQFVGNGIRRLIHLAVPDGTPPELEEQCYQDYLPYYQIHCADHTRPYEGITGLLSALRSGGCRIAVVSNKADSAVQSLCEQYFPGAFDYAVGERPGISKKPAPDSVNEVLQKLGFARDQAVYIGDSEVDILTARNAGMDSLTVTWGFRDEEFLMNSGAVRLVHRPEEISEFILAQTDCDIL